MKMEEEIIINGKRVVQKTLNYGEYLEAYEEAERTKANVSLIALCKGIVSWDFTDPLTGKPLPIKPESLKKIEPFGDVIRILDSFNRLNHLTVEDKKKSSEPSDAAGTVGRKKLNPS